MKLTTWSIFAVISAMCFGCPNSAGARGPTLPAPVGCNACWHPPLYLNWQWQLSGKLDASVKGSMYDVDMFDSTAAQVAHLHALSRKAVCYIDAGSWENWRPDAKSFPKSVIGKPLQGWPGEKWLDIRKISILGPLMTHRLNLCRSKGFDGVEFDNVDGYQNQTGFPLTGREQLRYNVFLANLAHGKGLSVALKNDTDQVKTLLPYFDWSLDEQCFEYQECRKLTAFIKAGKPVFEVEYSLPISKFCPKAKALGFNSMRKHLNLGRWRQRCA